MSQAVTSKLKDFSLPSGDSLLVAIFLAALLHVIVLMSFSFNKTAKQSIKVGKSLEVSLVQKPAQKAPVHAKTLAADNQEAGGAANSKAEFLAEKLPAAISNAQNQTELVEREAMPEPKKQQKKMLTQTTAEVNVNTLPALDESAEAVPVQPKLSIENLEQQIAQLGERVRDSQQLAEESKIKFVNSISAHKYLAAQYEKDLIAKLERTGELNFPEGIKNIRESQSLTMDIGINADGSIYSMRIVKSSGNPALDDAAKRIVKMSAPFAKLPAELLQEVNVLVITKVLKFNDETGMTTR